MSAYNWLTIQAECPSCQKVTELRAQVHTASSYEGDESGRFHDRTYHLGDKLSWWPRNDPRYHSWIPEFSISIENGASECCYAKCTECNEALYLVVKLENLVILEVEDVGFDSDWPAQFQR